jgi:hypothetical protein
LVFVGLCTTNNSYPKVHFLIRSVANSLVGQDTTQPLSFSQDVLTYLSDEPKWDYQEYEVSEYAMEWWKSPGTILGTLTQADLQDALEFHFKQVCNVISTHPITLCMINCYQRHDEMPPELYPRESPAAEVLENPEDIPAPAPPPKRSAPGGSGGTPAVSPFIAIAPEPSVILSANVPPHHLSPSPVPPATLCQKCAKYKILAHRAGLGIRMVHQVIAGISEAVATDYELKLRRIQIYHALGLESERFGRIELRDHHLQDLGRYLRYETASDGSSHEEDDGYGLGDGDSTPLPQDGSRLPSQTTAVCQTSSATSSINLHPESQANLDISTHDTLNPWLFDNAHGTDFSSDIQESDGGPMDVSDDFAAAPIQHGDRGLKPESVSSNFDDTDSSSESDNNQTS